jgi:hydroxyacylglutathione hydrolase
VIRAEARDADIDFVTGAPIDGAAEPVWIHGAPARKQCTDSAIHVHQSDRHTFVLRVSKAASFEAPFIFCWSFHLRPAR